VKTPRFSVNLKLAENEDEANDPELVRRVHEGVWADIHQRAKAQNISELKAAGYDFHRGVNRFDELLDAIQTLQPEAKSALASQLLNAWTAFEVLSGDLWVAALNENPAKLVQPFIQAAEKNPEKTIPISAIQKVGYDLAHSMGTILRETGRANFISLSSTRRVYEKTFGETFPPIFKDENLRILELVRNLLAHRAGEIDERFLNEIAPLKHPFENLQLRQTLQLDGMIVRDLSLAAITRGRELAIYVDNCLQSATEDNSEFGHVPKTETDQ